MNLKSLKPTLFKLHRWIGIGLAPLFLLITLSGAVLAFKPILEQPTSPGDETITATRVINLLQQIDPLGQEVVALSIDSTTNQAQVRSRDPQIAGRYDLISGACACDNEGSAAFNLFEFTEHLHKELLLGADILVQIASYLMLLLVITAPLLAWPRLRNNLMGWHRGAGWIALPIVLMLPLTGVFMSLHLGMPELPRMSQPGVELTLAEALESAQQAHQLDGLTGVRRFRGGTVLLSVAGQEAERLLVVTDHSITPFKPSESLVKTLHEGTWAGPISGVINLTGALALSLLILSGSFSWMRRRRRMRERRALAAA
ncbi:MAG: PepSY-associated TM helix domain-containing protein [Candidatus Thiodiazotropha sp.]